jgi:hypothetical protein
VQVLDARLTTIEELLVQHAELGKKDGCGQRQKLHAKRCWRCTKLDEESLGNVDRRELGCVPQVRRVVRLILGRE